MVMYVHLTSRMPEHPDCFASLKLREGVPPCFANKSANKGAPSKKLPDNATGSF